MLKLQSMSSMRYFTATRSIHNSLRILQKRQSGRENEFLYTSTVSELAQKISTSLAARDPTVAREQVLDALKACKTLQDRVSEHDKLGRDAAHEQIQKQIDLVLSNEKVVFDSELLRQVFLLKFPQATTIKMISQFYSRNPTAFIEKGDALIPFRESLFNADLHSALKITDMTTGHPNYIKHKNEILRRGTLQLAASAIGITLFSKLGVQQIIEMGWLSPTWKHLASLNAMLLTYLLNSSFFVTVVKFGRQLSSAGGDFLTWQKGTFYTHWYRHADEMAMCTKIMEADVKLNGGPGNSAWLVEELCRKDDRLADGSNLKGGFTRDGHKIRLLEPKDSIEDLKLQAYWMSGGDGFEWVEPDQDPAEILWKRHLETLNAPAVKGADAKTLKWAEDLIEEK